MIDFPNTPAIGQSFTPLTGRGYFWDGTSWNALARRMPSPWAFVDVTNAVTNTLYVSNTVTVAQLAAAAPVSVTGGSYSRNGGAATTATGMVVNGDTIAVNVASALTLNAAVDAVLRIGGASDIFTVTTATTVDPNRSKIRVSQLLMEPVYKTPSKIRATQILMEPVYKTPSKVRLSQILMEVVRSVGFTGAGTVLDPATATVTPSIFNGSLYVQSNTTGTFNVRATTSKTTGKWVFAMTGISGIAWQIMLATSAINNFSAPQASAVSVAMRGDGIIYVASVANTTNQANRTYNATQEIMFAVDLDAKLVWLKVEGKNWNGDATANPATGVGGISYALAGALFPGMGFFSGTASDQARMNFGQSAFVSSIPAGFAAWG